MLWGNGNINIFKSVFFHFLTVKLYSNGTFFRIFLQFLHPLIVSVGKILLAFLSNIEYYNSDVIHQNFQSEIGGFIVNRWTKVIFILAALLLTCFIFPTNAASADIENAPWREFIPSIRETRRDDTHRIESHPDGIRIRVEVNPETGWRSRWWRWNIESDSDRRANDWQIRGTFERRLGVSGVMFGQEPMFIYAVLDDANFYLVELTRNPDNHRILKQVELRPEHRQMQSVVLTITLKRDTGTIKCLIGNAEYIDVSGISLPLVEHFGFVAISRDETSTAVFNKIERRWSSN